MSDVNDQRRYYERMMDEIAVEHRQQIDQLEKQNAKLRDRITHLEADRRELEKRLASLESTHEVLADFDDDLEQECADFIVENRKLRKLVRDYDMYIMTCNPRTVEESIKASHDLFELRVRMRELGVVVE